MKILPDHWLDCEIYIPQQFLRTRYHTVKSLAIKNFAGLVAKKCLVEKKLADYIYICTKEMVKQKVGGSVKLWRIDRQSPNFFIAQVFYHTVLE